MPRLVAARREFDFGFAASTGACPRTLDFLEACYRLLYPMIRKEVGYFRLLGNLAALALTLVCVNQFIRKTLIYTHQSRGSEFKWIWAVEASRGLRGRTYPDLTNPTRPSSSRGSIVYHALSELPRNDASILTSYPRRFKPQ
ncbi:hypothetical protein NMY22_g5946 [Coprinellus aureogranulatus]|nr:hypothetical protein NMY22_g5946 [Coprinellus aureogranulatus]